jgi:hypothetical protein
MNMSLGLDNIRVPGHILEKLRPCSSAHQTWCLRVELKQRYFRRTFPRDLQDNGPCSPELTQDHLGPA